MAKRSFPRASTPLALCSAPVGRAAFRLALSFVVPFALGLAATQAAPAENHNLPAPSPGPSSLEPDPDAAPLSILHLSATLGASDAQSLHAGLQWRIFDEAAEIDGSHKLVAQSSEAAPAFSLHNGNFIVHAAFGLAGATKRVAIEGKGVSERLVLNAGALRIVGQLGDAPMPATRSSIAIYVPERDNSEAKLVVANAKTGDTIGLPEGNYHVVSTLLDAATNGAAAPTNSVVSADLRVQTGKLTDATLRHRAAIMTLKLVSGPGGEALANTAFTILTPGGDVIREMIGAFPSLILAEGEYVAIARHDNKTYQTTFKVTSTLDRDVEILAQ
ncbi:hypothetical protein [Methylocapsa acidiphila]|uniref:hypothetical protein n=1 Tax=Methylocapsa acidiphila TaxID=133552 RepID=UPI000421D8DB|nr:hypothetical protein [Methylocapsa acidiphila]